MTIPVVCPHCEGQFQLNAENAGKRIRCPNPMCREVFEVPASSAPVAIDPAPELKPYERVESTTDSPFTLATEGQNDLVIEFEAPEPVRPEPFLLEPDRPATEPLVTEVPSAAIFDESTKIEPPAPKGPRLRPLPSGKPVAPTPTPEPEKPTPPAKPLPVAATLPPPAPKGGPKEVVWSGDTPPVTPPTPPVSTTRRIEEPEDDDPSPRRRRARKRAWPKILLGFIALAVLGTIGFSVVALLRREALTEERMAEEAQTAYEEGNYALAQKRYEELVTGYPDSREIDRYKFFRAFSEARAAIGSVTARENPRPARQAFDQFLADYGSSPLAQPDSGVGVDVLDAGRRLADTIADHATDRIDEFKKNRKVPAPLTAAEQSIEDGKKLLPVIDRFRSKDGVTLDPQRTKFDGITKQIETERKRLGVIDPFRDLPNDPTAERIEEFERSLRDNQLANDAEARGIIAEAEKKVRDLVKYTPGLALASGPLPTAAPLILFSGPLGGVPSPRATIETTPDVVFAVVRGILYALDAQTGGLVWGVRVAAPTADPRTVDLPVRVPMADGLNDWVLVLGEAEGKSTLTARMVRTGEVIWNQFLPAAAAGRPLVVGGRIYLPLRDRLGTVLEYEIATGSRMGQLAIRQPIGAGLSAVPAGKPGVSFLFIPADAQRVFVFEIGREDSAGRRLMPRCVRVLLTEHPRDSLRTEPLLIGQGEEQGPRFLILLQTDGPTNMKVRTYPLPKAETLTAEGTTDQALAKPSEIAVPGWSWFPPATDGERVTLATDAAAFLALGVNQPGGADQPLFTLPGPKAASEQDGVARSQIIQAEEDAYWVVLGGQLIRLRAAIDAGSGFRIVAQGAGRPVGEPVHRAQVRPALNLGLVVSRSGVAANAQAVAFDLTTGQIRWQRRLGMTPAGPAVARTDGTALVVDEDGGVYSVAPGKAEQRTLSGAIVAEGIVPPFGDLGGRATVVASADGESVWVLAPEADKAGRRLRARYLNGGALKREFTVPLPDQPAGRPIVLGSSVLVPLANGYVYRLAPGDDQLNVGPLWRSEGTPDALCYLSSISAEEFLATDGGRRFLRWRWQTTAKPEKLGGPWEAKARLAAPAVVLNSAAGLRFATFDVDGLLLMFTADRPGEPIRRWKGEEGSAIPAGKPGDDAVPITWAKGVGLIYSIDRRHLVAINPEQDVPAWVAKDLVAEGAGELTGFVVNGNRVIVTDQLAKVTLLQAETGAPQTSLSGQPGGTVAYGPTIPLRNGEGFLLLDDGSATTVTLPARP